MRYYNETITNQCKNCSYIWEDGELKSNCPKCGSGWIDDL